MASETSELQHRWDTAMSWGVTDFIKGNSLKVGDLCTFHLVDGNQMVFKVSITRNATVKEE